MASISAFVPNQVEQRVTHRGLDLVVITETVGDYVVSTSVWAVFDEGRCRLARSDGRWFLSGDRQPDGTYTYPDWLVPEARRAVNALLRDFQLPNGTSPTDAETNGETGDDVFAE